MDVVHVNLLALGGEIRAAQYCVRAVDIHKCSRESGTHIFDWVDIDIIVQGFRSEI